MNPFKSFGCSRYFLNPKVITFPDIILVFSYPDFNVSSGHLIIKLDAWRFRVAAANVNFLRSAVVSCGLYKDDEAIDHLLVYNVEDAENILAQLS